MMDMNRSSASVNTIHQKLIPRAEWKCWKRFSAEQRRTVSIGTERRAPAVNGGNICFLSRRIHARDAIYSRNANRSVWWASCSSDSRNLSRWALPYGRASLLENGRLLGRRVVYPVLNSWWSDKSHSLLPLARNFTKALKWLGTPLLPVTHLTSWLYSLGPKVY